jgi:hypothetical protein
MQPPSIPTGTGTIGSNKISAVFALHAIPMYYEWNDKDQTWMKLVETDPDPDPNLPAGRFDGQVIEIKKEAT